MTKHPLVPGDRVRHAGQQYTGQATATIVEVKQGALKTWEYLVRHDDPTLFFAADGTSWWNSDATVFVEKQRCPDDGTCHHACGETSCFRVVLCAPLGREDWTPEEIKAHPADGLRASVEAVIVSGDV